MPTATDQLGRTVTLADTPRRIVSLVPSITELLAEYELEEEVVGITKFCTHPPAWFVQKARVGGTKTIDVARVRALCPDLIIANQEENDRDAVEQLMREFPVYVSRIATLDDADDLYGALGKLTGRTEAATDFRERCHTVKMDVAGAYGGRRAAYLIWREPYMAAGGDTYISAVMEMLGLINVFADRSRYPTVSVADMERLGVERVLLSSEPFPFKGKHLEELRELLPRPQIGLVDGRAFSWYGPGFLLLADTRALMPIQP